MADAKNILTIDAGNTQIKVGFFEGNTLQKVERVGSGDLKSIKEIVDVANADVLVFSSVLSDDITSELKSIHSNCFEISTRLDLPFLNQYETPETLGIDRLCNAAFMNKELKTAYGVCIDIGTCLKFDVLSAVEGYMGGSIGPGLGIRYKSLNTFTGKLPLISNNSPSDLVGKSTESSISSGVINGMTAEINGIMSEYEARYKDLTFFVTGGDAGIFDIHSKNDIFADENLTLKGMIEIYNCNA